MGWFFQAGLIKPLVSPKGQLCSKHFSEVADHPDSICFIMEFAAGGELPLELRRIWIYERKSDFFKFIPSPKLTASGNPWKSKWLEDEIPFGMAYFRGLC